MRQSCWSLKCEKKKTSKDPCDPTCKYYIFPEVPIDFTFKETTDEEFMKENGIKVEAESKVKIESKISLEECSLDGLPNVFKKMDVVNDSTNVVYDLDDDNEIDWDCIVEPVRITPISSLPIDISSPEPTSGPIIFEHTIISSSNSTVTSTKTTETSLSENSESNYSNVVEDLTPITDQSSRSEYSSKESRSEPPTEYNVDDLMPRTQSMNLPYKIDGERSVMLNFDSFRLLVWRILLVFWILMNIKEYVNYILNNRSNERKNGKK